MESSRLNFALLLWIIDPCAGSCVHVKVHLVGVGPVEGPALLLDVVDQVLVVHVVGVCSAEGIPTQVPGVGAAEGPGRL